MTKDGGPAFPCEITQTASLHGPDTLHLPGMSLRDWFAGQALAGMMAQSHSGPKQWVEMGHGWGEDTLNQLNRHDKAVVATMAGFAYRIADAMLAQRDRADG